MWASATSEVMSTRVSATSEVMSIMSTRASATSEVMSIMSTRASATSEVMSMHPGHVEQKSDARFMCIKGMCYTYFTGEPLSI